MHFNNGAQLAKIQNLLRGCIGAQMQSTRDEPCPSGLVVCTETGSIVAVEILVEKDVIAPMRVLLESCQSSIDWPFPFAIAQKNAGQPAAEFLCDLEKRHIHSGTGRTLDRK